MYTLTLSYKGFVLEIDLRRKAYYAKTVFELGKKNSGQGKTMYQIMFEHLIDGKTVSLSRLARQYKKVNPDIRAAHLGQLIKTIEAAVAKSPNKNLRRKKFKRLPKGGANPVLARKHSYSRFTVAQREIIEGTLLKIHSEEKKVTFEDARIACLEALRHKQLSQDVTLSYLAINRARKRLGLPIHPKKPSPAKPSVPRPKRPKRRL